MSVVCVGKYHSVEEALVAKSKLEFYGIPVWFVEEYAARCKWIYLQGASHCHIEVPKSCMDDAIFLLEQTDNVEDEDYDEVQLSSRFWPIALLVCLSVHSIGLIFLLDHLYHWWRKSRC